MIAPCAGGHIGDFYGHGADQPRHALKHFHTLLHKLLHYFTRLSRNFDFDCLQKAFNRDTARRLYQRAEHCHIGRNLAEDLMRQLVRVNVADLGKTSSYTGTGELTTRVHPGRMPSVISMPTSSRLVSKQMTQFGR